MKRTHNPLRRALSLFAFWTSCSLFAQIPFTPPTEKSRLSAVPMLRTAGTDFPELNRDKLATPTRFTAFHEDVALPELRFKVILPDGATLPDPFRGLIDSRDREKSTLARINEFRIRPNDLRGFNVLNDTMDGVVFELIRPLDFEPGVVSAFNEDARISHYVDEFIGTFSAHTQEGASIWAAVFDEGKVLSSHREFQMQSAPPRVVIDASNTSGLSTHSTHVAGTMAAAGIRREAIGMAKRLNLRSYNWISDLQNLDQAAGAISVSNHSYGPVSGWSRDPKTGQWLWFGDVTHSSMEDSNFGKYRSDNRSLDELLWRHSHVLTFVSAGNDRDDGPASQPVSHYVWGINPETYQPGWLRTRESRHPDGFDRGGIDTVTGLGLAKNAICVGAIHDVSRHSPQIRLTAFSGVGPADDGRIKPDLVANGQTLLSVSDATDTAYKEMSGTSMASPTAAGIGALLMEQYEMVHQTKPLAIEIKGVLIHTATDGGLPGPDPFFGWGSINAFKAGEIIERSGSRPTLYRRQVGQHATESLLLQRAAGTTEPIRVTAVWADPAGAINTGGLDDAVPTLVNDVDLRLTSPSGKMYYPYRLNLAKPLMAAEVSGPNRVDNVEVVDAPHEPGVWTVELIGSQLRVGDQQLVALVVSGLDSTP